MLAAGRAMDACLEAAEAEIQKAPEKSEMFVTTSRLYKRHLAEYFCDTGKDRIALELGVYHGHTTAVLASIFRRVISVDIEKEYLEIAGGHCRNHSNVVFLCMDLMVDSWNVFASNDVNVAVIDANHHYEHVRADAENVLRHLPHVEFLVFDDYVEDGVARAVTELEDAGVLVACRGIGIGWNGSSWKFRDFDPANGLSFERWTNRSEGRICERSKSAAPSPSFIDQRFYLYKQPLEHLCMAGVFRLLAGGHVVTSAWGSGIWKTTARADVLLLQLPEMFSGPAEIHFNSGRVAFYLSRFGSAEADWFGILDHWVQRPFQAASSLFG